MSSRLGFATTHVLLHCDPVDNELHGTWVSDDGVVPLEFYPGGEMCAEHQYAEEVLGVDTWAARIRRLPETSPYAARWDVVPRLRGESAEAAFYRVQAEIAGLDD